MKWCLFLKLSFFVNLFTYYIFFFSDVPFSPFDFDSFLFALDQTTFALQILNVILSFFVLNFTFWFSYPWALNKPIGWTIFFTSYKNHCLNQSLSLAIYLLLSLCQTRWRAEHHGLGKCSMDCISWACIYQFHILAMPDLCVLLSDGLPHWSTTISHMF